MDGHEIQHNSQSAVFHFIPTVKYGGGGMTILGFFIVTGTGHFTSIDLTPLYTYLQSFCCIYCCSSEVAFALTKEKSQMLEACAMLSPLSQRAGQIFNVHLMTLSKLRGSKGSIQILNATYNFAYGTVYYTPVLSSVWHISSGSLAVKNWSNYPISHGVRSGIHPGQTASPSQENRESLLLK